MKRRAAVATAIAVATTLVVGAGILFLTTSRPPDVRATADDYLSALAAGDYAAIEALRGPGPDAATDTDTRRAFEGAEEYVSDVRVQSVSSDATTGRGRASVQMGGGRHTIDFAFTLVDGRWLLSDDHLGALTVTTTLGDSVRVGGALVPVDTEVRLLPARYSVTAAPAGLLDGEIEVVVTSDERATATLDARPTPDASAQAQAQLDAYADTCTEGGTDVAPHCGIRVPWAADLASLDRIAFRIEKYPVASIAADGATFAATGGVIVATATGISRAGGTASFTYRADDWALRGTVSFTGDEMVLAVG